ncbi:MAG: 16S rRNA (guanine(966)-N(2))-methyltransferase RsmD [Thermoleophilia bacterium]
MARSGLGGDVMPGRVRIIAGSLKGRRLMVPRGSEVRPTGERVREALFSALGPVEGLLVVDLFAGTGALGLEALSRGAAKGVFVEADRRVAAVLARNVEAVGVKPRAEVWQMDHQRALRRMRAAGVTVDLLFLDPPYRMLPAVLAEAAANLAEVLAPGGILVIEAPRTFSAQHIPASLGHPAFEMVFERRYGDTVLIMIRKGNETT